MKIIVMETRDGKAAALDEQGIFHLIEDKNYIVGQKLDLSETELYVLRAKHRGAAGRFGKFRFTGASKVAAAVLACVLAGGGVTAYAAPVSTVTLSQDYTVEYQLNIFDRVIRMETDIPEEVEADESLNAALLKKVKGKNIADAIDMTLEAMENLTMGDEGTALQLDVIGIGDKEKLAEELSRKVDEWNEKRPQNPQDDSSAGVSDDERKGDHKGENQPETEIQDGPDDKPGGGTDGQSQTGQGQNGDIGTEQDPGSGRRELDNGRPDDAQGNPGGVKENSGSRKPGGAQGNPDGGKPNDAQGDSMNTAPDGVQGDHGSTAPGGAQGNPDNAVPSGAQGSPDNAVPSGAQGNPDSAAQGGAQGSPDNAPPDSGAAQNAGMGQPPEDNRNQGAGPMSPHP